MSMGKGLCGKGINESWHLTWEPTRSLWTGLELGQQNTLSAALGVTDTFPLFWACFREEVVIVCDGSSLRSQEQR